MTLGEKFCEIARSVPGSAKTNFKQKTCPDQCVGEIAKFGHDTSDFPRRGPAIQRESSPYVILVMESPHTQEFDGEPGPAKGSTGDQIRRHIAEILRELSPSPPSELILVNAIQYQCSLGVDTEVHRDEVFRRFWEKGGRRDFEERLTQVYNPGDLLLNCCTDGKPTKGLRKLVTAAIHDSLGMVPLHSGPHPCSWYSPRNRRSVRLVAPLVAHPSDKP